MLSDLPLAETWPMTWTVSSTFPWIQIPVTCTHNVETVSCSGKMMRRLEYDI